MLNAQYIPILRTRQNERLAVADIPDDVRSIVAPLFDITAPDEEKDHDESVAYIERNINQLAKRLSGHPELLIDSSIMKAAIRLTNDIHPLLLAGTKLIESGIAVTPVSGLARDKAHWDAAIAIVEQLQHKQICLRLDNEDLQLPSDTTEAIRDLKQDLLADVEIIILFDCESVFEDDLSSLGMRILRIIEDISPWVSDSVIVAACGMPKSIRQVAAISESAYVKRKEINLWKHVKQLDKSGKIILFGDYTTINPNYEMIDPKITYRVTAPKIIYTLPNEWFVIRGKRLHDHGADQYFDLAADVVALPEYRGRDYSAGDEYIQLKADRIGNPGRPGTWVRPCLSHHLTLTAREVVK